MRNTHQHIVVQHGPKRVVQQTTEMVSQHAGVRLV